MQELNFLGFDHNPNKVNKDSWITNMNRYSLINIVLNAVARSSTYVKIQGHNSAIDLNIPKADPSQSQGFSKTDIFPIFRRKTLKGFIRSSTTTLTLT